MKIVGVQVSNELEHAYVHAHTVTVDVLATIAAEKQEGIWSSLFVVGKKTTCRLQHHHRNSCRLQVCCSSISL